MNNCVNGKNILGGLSAPVPGLYMHIKDHYFQASSSLKPLGQSTLKKDMH